MIFEALVFWTLEPNVVGANLPNPAYVPQPNESFKADAKIGHGFAIFMANVGALRPVGLRRRLTRALDLVSTASMQPSASPSLPTNFWWPVHFLRRVYKKSWYHC